jgi:hypothetical protein
MTPQEEEQEEQEQQQEQQQQQQSVVAWSDNAGKNITGFHPKTC